MNATTTKPAPAKGLGKGLSALISENATPVSVKKPEATGASTYGANSGLALLPVNQLHSGKYQPRMTFDEGALTELAESIEKNGIMQPIVVRPVAQAGRFEIVAGERRWRAAKIAGLQNVPVIVRDITDKQALELALVENIQRQDLTVLEEANGYQRLIEEFDYTQEELAITVGKSRSHVTNLLRLLALPEEVKDMLARGDITAGHARALLGSPDPLVLARAIVEKGLNVRQAEQISRVMQGNPKRIVPRAASPQAPAAPRSQMQYSAAQGPKDPDILALEESLSENLGLRVSINDRGQAGEIVLAYDSLGQLDEILRRLSAEAVLE